LCIGFYGCPILRAFGSCEGWGLDFPHTSSFRTTGTPHKTLPASQETSPRIDRPAPNVLRPLQLQRRFTLSRCLRQRRRVHPESLPVAGSNGRCDTSFTPQHPEISLRPFTIGKFRSEKHTTRRTSGVEAWAIRRTHLRTEQMLNTVCQSAHAFRFSNYRVDSKPPIRKCSGNRFAVHGE
jgi:hypothetical protein